MSSESDLSESEFEISGDEDSDVENSKAKLVANKAKPAKPKEGILKKKVKDPKSNARTKNHDTMSGTEDDDFSAVKIGRNSMEKAQLSKKFQKKTQLEHIMLRPDVYIGSPDKTEEKCWVYNSEKKCLEFKKVDYSPGLYKIVDEILVNAADNRQRDTNMKYIKVTINKDSGVIAVENDGQGIPIEVHQQHQIYIPELIFGHLLTGENFEDTKKRVVGGKNGYGAKLANIFSKWFEVETADSKSGKKYVQRWTDNMSICSKPQITDFGKKSKDYTRISFLPDFKRFQSEKMEDDIYDLLCKRVYDIAGVTGTKLKVSLNGEILKVNGFEKYCDMYIEAINRKEKRQMQKKTEDDGSAIEDLDDNSLEDDVIKSENDGPWKVYQKINDFWEICVSKSPGSFGQVSYVNSLCTYKGGKHVDYVCELIIKIILEKLKKDKACKGTEIKNVVIKNNLFVFINCLIVNPTFDSQSKHFLSTSSANFGDKENLPEFNAAFAKKLVSGELIDSIRNDVQAKNLKKIGDKAKNPRSGVLAIEKLDDANKAGTADWRNCTLILTEGDSAKALAVSGLTVIGKGTYGVFPLKGKLLNVREASTKQILANQEIQNICKIVGLVPGKKPAVSEFEQEKSKSKSGLRYGHIMIMTDQDHDGSHIKGLLFNFIHYYWPELLQTVKDFIQVFITPIIKCSKRGDGKSSKALSFYTLSEYHIWAQTVKDLSKYSIKYYKGLGTSTSAEAKEYFKELTRNTIRMKWDREEHVSDEAIQLAFSKNKANDRKKWLSDHNELVEDNPNGEHFIDFKSNKITYAEFVNKELVHFSLADNVRSIPNVIDGFKPSQRKVLFATFKKFLRNGAYNTSGEIKVAQLSGYVSEKSAYHHGEASLVGTIVSLAQDYVGSNNINFLRPEGQFGTRAEGGKDAASGRYIFTGVSKLAAKIFRTEDNDILSYLREEGIDIEPEYYLPIIPVVLVNGTQGIGTGWSTEVPSYNPKDLVAWILNRLDREEGLGEHKGDKTLVHPWYRGYRGSILQAKASQYLSRGNFTVKENVKTKQVVVHVTELPIGRWTEEFNNYVKKLIQDNIIADHSIDAVEQGVSIRVQIDEESARKNFNGDDQIIKTLRLERSISTANMHLFDKNHKIKKYGSPEEILEEFFEVRLAKYKERREYILNQLELKLRRLSNEERFVLAVATGEISLKQRTKSDLEAELEKRGFERFIKSGGNKRSEGQKADGQSESESQLLHDADEEEENTLNDGVNYGYLLGLPILKLTLEKVELIKKARAEQEDMYLAYKKKTHIDLWRSELEDFLVEYENFLKNTRADETVQTTVALDPLTLAAQKSSSGKDGPKGYDEIIEVTNEDTNGFDISDSESESNEKKTARETDKIKNKELSKKKRKTPDINSDIEDISMSEIDEEACDAENKIGVSSSAINRPHRAADDVPIKAWKKAKPSKTDESILRPKKAYQFDDDSDGGHMVSIAEQLGTENRFEKPSLRTKLDEDNSAEEDDDSSVDDITSPVRKPAVKRPARAAAIKKTTYVQDTTSSDDGQSEREDKEELKVHTEDKLNSKATKLIKTIQSKAENPPSKYVYKGADQLVTKNTFGKISSKRTKLNRDNSAVEDDDSSVDDIASPVRKAASKRPARAAAVKKTTYVQDITSSDDDHSEREYEEELKVHAEGKVNKKATKVGKTIQSKAENPPSKHVHKFSTQDATEASVELHGTASSVVAQPSMRPPRVAAAKKTTYIDSSDEEFESEDGEESDDESD